MSEKDLFLTAKEYALKRLERRECSSQDIYRRLIQKGIPAEVVLAVLSELKKANLIDDERFAKLLAREQAARGKGPYFIRQKLREKGISLNPQQTKTLTEEVTQTTELDAAKELVRRRYLGVLPVRALQALLRRGFSYPVARAALACPDLPDVPDGDETHE